MLSRWVPFLRPRVRPKEKHFDHSLVRTVLVVLLLTSLLPILLIGTLNAYRSRSLLHKQVSDQMQSILAYQVRQVTDYADLRSKMADRLVTDSNFHDALLALLNTPDNSSEHFQAKSMISYSFRGKPQTAAEDFFQQMFIVRPNGSVALATNDDWVAKNFGGPQVSDSFVRSLIGTNQERFVYSPLPGYNKQLVFFVTRSFTDDKGAPVATMVAVSTPDLAYSVLADANSFLSGVSSYYFTDQAQLIGPGEKNSLADMPINHKFADSLRPLINSQGAQALFPTWTYQGKQATASAQWLANYGIGLTLLVDDFKVIGPAIMIDPFNLILLLVSLSISGALIYYSSVRLVNPLVGLAKTVDNFSRGNWEERASIKRNDEIGQLAASFNHMANELSDLYRSLEGVVEKRTSQLRIASEVAQLSTTTANLNDTLGRTVELIAERFGFYHVAIYLFDETGQNLILREASGFSGEQIKQQGDRLATSDSTLVAWTADNRQARIISDVATDPLFRANDLLPDTQSEVTIPIILGTEVLGVLDIQSTLVNTFDEETIAVFQTLANQISSTLHSTRLLESTQVSYQETSLLYRATRQVTQSRGEADIVQTLTDVFIQLSYIGAILSVEEENFKILVLTDPKTGRVEKSLQSLNIPIGQMAKLLTENRVVLIEDIAQPNDYDNLLSFLLRRGLKSAAMVSILENGRLSKVMVLSSRESDLITHTRLQPYANLAEVIGASLEKYRVLNTLQQRLTELQILANFSQAISVETNLRNLYRVLHEQVMQTLGTDLEFAVALYDEPKNQIEFPYYYENRQMVEIQPIQLGEGLTSVIIQTQKPLLLNNIAAIQTYHRRTTGQPARSWLGVPLIFAGKVIGAILIQDLANENRFNEDDVNLFMTLAPQIATAVRNTQLYTETQQALRAYDQERFLFNTLLDNIPEGVSVKDVHSRYIRASESVARMYNTSAENITGKTVFDLMDRAAAENIFRDEQMVMNMGRAEIGLIQRMVSPNGAETWMHTSRIPIRTASGDPFGLLIIQRDITEIKQAEALAQRRAEQVLTAAEIARDATGTLDVKMLLEKTINLIRERFGFYHASIFLLDAAGDYAVLRSSTGEAGQQMLQDGHRLGIGSKSIVGQVTGNAKPLIVNDVTTDPTHLPNPLLPETRSELAIPMVVGERVLGALDVQSTQQNAFNAEDVGVLQILADQLAVAVVNGDLFAKTQELLGKHRLLRQISIAASTSTNMEDALTNVVSGLRTAMVGDRIGILILNEEGHLQVQTSAGYEGTKHLEARISLGEGITGLAALEKQPIRVNDTQADPRYISLDPDVRSELAIPILFSDELLGVLNLESMHIAAFDENDQEILGALGNNLGGVIANIRLINQVRQQVTRERQLYEVTSKIRRSVDLETILETSATEIAHSLGARRASIRITAGALPELPDLNTNLRSSDKGLGSNGNSSAGGSQSNGNGKRSGSNGHNGQEA